MSFTVLISLVDIIYFIAELAYGLNTDGQFLEVTSDSIADLGGKWPYQMRENYQIQRFFLPIIMHANFLHISSNLFSQIIFGTRIESWFGTTKIIIIYLLSGVSGNLFSNLMAEESCYAYSIPNCLSVGASTSIMGLLGCLLGYVILYWSDIPSRDRSMLLCYTIFLILYTLLFGLGSDHIDNNGHIGGLIMGILLGFVLCEVKPDKKWGFG